MMKTYGNHVTNKYDKYFKNQDHLNELGGELFVNILFNN